MTIRKATLKDNDLVLNLLDEFREDCIEQITGKPGKSDSAMTKGTLIYESLLNRKDYTIFLLFDSDSKPVGIITGYLCPMLRSGEMRAEVEEFYVKKEYRGGDNAKKLMNYFIDWCKDNNVQKVNLESDNELSRAHGFYEKYGFESKARRFVKKL